MCKRIFSYFFLYTYIDIHNVPHDKNRPLCLMLQMTTYFCCVMPQSLSLFHYIIPIFLLRDLFKIVYTVPSWWDVQTMVYTTGWMFPSKVSCRFCFRVTYDGEGMVAL